MTDTTVHVRALAERFVNRSEALGYRGKKRDDAALDYFIGAATLAESLGDEPLAQHLGRIASFVIAIRGFKAVKDIAQPKT